MTSTLPCSTKYQLTPEQEKLISELAEITPKLSKTGRRRALPMELLAAYSGTALRYGSNDCGKDNDDA